MAWKIRPLSIFCLVMLMLTKNNVEGLPRQPQDTAEARQRQEKLNDAIDHMAHEVHLPGYNYCGPGTKLQERLASGDPPVNALDEACRIHDLEYAATKNQTARLRADADLLGAAERVYKSNETFKVKMQAYGVMLTLIIKAKITGDLPD